MFVHMWPSLSKDLLLYFDKLNQIFINKLECYFQNLLIEDIHVKIT